MKRLFLFTFSLIALFSPAFAVTEICDVTIEPDNKVAAFANGQQVNITMGYFTDEPGGVRIFVRPFTNGSLSPGYAASGSPIYSGSGIATGTFTINTGSVVVNEIRIEVYNANQTELLRRFWVPVNFRFGSVGVNNFSYSGNPELTSLLLGEDYTCSFHYNVNYPGGVRIFVRPFTNGSLTPHYSASGSPIYTGTGTNASATFRVNLGKNVRVDALKVQILSADQSVNIDEFFIPVNICYSTVKITDIVNDIGIFPYNNENRAVNFKYSTTESTGVRIFPRPWTNGALTPDYSASGSPLYNGSGNGNGTFTVTKGNQRVDHVRFNVVNADQSETLLQFLSPAEYCFGNLLISDVEMCPPSPARLANNERVNMTVPFYNDENEPVRIFVMPMSQGSEAPAFGVSGSELFTTSTGEAKRYFTITAGNVVVDQVRFRITNADQSTLLAEYFFPVKYVFGNPTVGVNDPLDIVEAASVYPNPAGDAAFLSVSLETDALAQVYVTDLSGRRVADLGRRSLTAHTQEVFPIQAHRLSPGMYIVVLEGEHFSKSLKLVVER